METKWRHDRGIGGFRMDVIDLIGKEVDAGLCGIRGECLVSNYEPCGELGERLALRPYESFAIALDARAA